MYQIKKETQNSNLFIFFIFSVYLFFLQKLGGQGQDDSVAFLFNFLPFIILFQVIFIEHKYIKVGLAHYYFVKIILLFLTLFFIPSFFILQNSNDMYFKGFRHGMQGIFIPLLSAYILSFIYQKQKYEIGFNIIFFACVITILKNFDYSSFNLSLLKIFQGNIEIKSESDIISFMLALFCLYYFVTKKYIYFLVSIIFSFLAFKRICFIAIIFSIFCYFLLNKSYIKKIISKKLLLMTVLAINITIPLLSISYSIEDSSMRFWIDSFFNINSSEFTAGRDGFYRTIYYNYGYPTLVGEGFNKVQIDFPKMFGEKFSIHSDLLKNIYEIGLLGYVCWIYFWYKNNSQSVILLCNTVMVNITFISDNTFLYGPTLFLYYLMQTYYLNRSFSEN